MIYINEIKTYRRNIVKKLFEQEKSYAEISHLIDYSESWLRKLHTKYKKDKATIMLLHKPGGSTCRLSDANIVRLRQVLDFGAVAYDLEGVFWGGKRVKYLIKQEFDIDYDVEYISEILSKINYTLQKPVKKDFRQKEEVAKKWTEETFPLIKKSSTRP
jgi:transposase